MPLGGLHESEVMPLKPQRRVRDYVDCVVDGSQFGKLHGPQNYDWRLGPQLFVPVGIQMIKKV